jgi:hypothetical protein
MVDFVSVGWIECACHFRRAGRHLGFGRRGCDLGQWMLDGFISPIGIDWGERLGAKVQEGENVLAEMV